jgi:hypothetical protein
MPDPTDKTKESDPIKQELENATIAPPAWSVHRQSLSHSDNSGNKPIPKSFIDAILEVIAQSIEKVLAEVMARCVAEGVEQKLRPLSQEIALLRIAIEHDWDGSGRRRGFSSEDDENPA